MLTPSKSLLTDTLLAPPPSVSAFSGSTICSTTSEPKNRRLLPRVPDHSRGSSGFNCTFCGCMQLPTTQGHVWRKHVFADLAPYMCIRSRCRSAGTFYTSKKAWVLHDTLCIRDAREGAGETTTEVCPFCLKDFGRDTGRFYSHVAHHMEDIRLFALPPAFREYEVGDYKDSSGMGSSEHTKSSRGRSPIGVHVAKNKAVDPLGTREWAMQAEGNIDVAESTRTVSVSSLESDSESMTRRFRCTLGEVTPAGMKALSGHREGMGWDERLRSTPGHAPPSRSTSRSEESSVNG
ncbi:hypothetical protein P167DRAFT_83451 [Morchella conica CCBAS932]|uniref:C2H2-type domain-containing protein n=1 Tax=Morchella conica CCBAS932 TaxID=1392247 RepID=A0A3N4K869_9PEZI|nr:hypothetical protein P167DRAFT_83451 [Morchella conica CCBAS932]